MLSIPFPGSKKEAYKHIKEVFEAGGYRNVIEPFGGSCVLSVNLKNEGLAERAVVNDYDGMFDLYPEYLDIKDMIREDFYSRGVYRTSHSARRGNYRYLDESESDWEVVDNRLLDEDNINRLQEIISHVDPKYWRLLSYGNNFAHSGVATHENVYLKDFRYFNAYVKTDKQRKFLKALDECERMSCDWREFMEANRDLLTPETLVILDPPYFGRYNSQYREDFTERDTMDLLETVRDTGCDFVFFNSDPEWVENTLDRMGIPHTDALPFGARQQTVNHKRREVWVLAKGGGND